LTELLLLRHAHAGDPQKWKGDDDDRPLSEKGRRQSERLGRLLSQVGSSPDIIVSSPRKRALETARIVARLLRMETTVDERLAGGLSLNVLDRLLGELGADRPMLVGHDPDFSSIVAAVCACEAIPMRKGALACLDVDRPVAPGRGVLRWLIAPELYDAPR
jgi:phosphohistidine phosphatase SixA